MLYSSSPTLWWETAACRSAFAADMYEGAYFNVASGMFSPSSTRRRAEHPVRRATWEDTLYDAQVRLDPRDDLKRSFSPCADEFCEHVGVPIASRTRVRPVRGFLDKKNRTLFTVPIEKSASSSVKHDFGYAHLSGCPHKSASALFAHMFNSTACEYAGSFHWDEHKTSVATVRSPFRRYLTALFDHGKLACDNTRCSLLERARSFIQQLSRRTFTMKLFPPHATIHFYTQSYFLSATDAKGTPVRWTRISRLEEARPRSHKNKKSDYSHILKYLMDDRSLRCDVCRVYHQDFVCFGYTGCEDCGRREKKRTAGRR